MSPTKRTFVSAFVALAFVTTGCNTGPSEAATTWCKANSAAVLTEAEHLFIKGTYDTLAGTNSPNEAFTKFLATRQGSDACKTAYDSR